MDTGKIQDPLGVVERNREASGPQFSTWDDFKFPVLMIGLPVGLILCAIAVLSGWLSVFRGL